MRRLLVVALAAVLLLGCSDRAEKIYETAQFEEQQFNVGHATQLYRQIVDEYPGSPYAEKAQRRLQELKGQ